MTAQEGEVSGKLVVEAIDVVKRFGERTIVGGFSTRIARGDRIGIVGANGAGKTTLLRLLTGDLAPDAGTVRLGANLVAVTLDQKREALDDSATVQETLTRGRGDTVMVGGTARHVVSYMKDFLFPPERARTPVAVLSGGERARLLLARALAAPANLLVLDEPTNDLDLETLDLLEELLADHPGTVLVVSHDRDFLDRVCTSVVVAEGDGRFQEYAGGWADMLSQRGAAAPARAALQRAAPTRPPAAPPAQAPARRPSIRRAAEDLAARVAELETSAAKLRTILADQGLYAKDPAAFAKASDTLVRVEAALAAAEDAWLAAELGEGAGGGA
jgi:ATP-binding cassette subfamily F protein uup